MRGGGASPGSGGLWLLSSIKGSMLAFRLIFLSPEPPRRELAETSSIYQILPPPVRKSRLKWAAGAKIPAGAPPGRPGLDPRPGVQTNGPGSESDCHARFMLYHLPRQRRGRPGRVAARCLVEGGSIPGEPDFRHVKIPRLFQTRGDHALHQDDAKPVLARAHRD